MIETLSSQFGHEMNRVVGYAGGRVAVKIVAEIYSRYIDQPETPLVFLPPQRALAVEFGVSLSTIQRALAMMEQQGVIRTEHGRGCRILRHGNAEVFRVAVLQASDFKFGRTSPQLVDAIHRQCLKRKWQVLSIVVDDVTPASVLRTMLDARVEAVALAIESREIMRTLLNAGILCVAIETDVQGLPIDQVYQDNFGAAAQAARHLLDRGHRRLGWIGPSHETLTAFMRFSGARAALNERHLDFQPCDILAGFSSEAIVEAYLARPDRPRALLTMWHDATVDLLRVAARLGLGPDDLDLVGWGVDKQVDEIAATAQAARIGMASMIWSPEEMAEAVVSRLQLHRTDPKLRPIHLVIPSRLVPIEGMPVAVARKQKRIVALA